MNRRKFLKVLGIGAAAASAGVQATREEGAADATPAPVQPPELEPAAPTTESHFPLRVRWRFITYGEEQSQITSTSYPYTVGCRRIMDFLSLHGCEVATYREHFDNGVQSLTSICGERSYESVANREHTIEIEAFVNAESYGGLEAFVNAGLDARWCPVPGVVCSEAEAVLSV